MNDVPDAVLVVVSVKVAVEPSSTELLAADTAMVGVRVSTARVTVLLVSDPSALALPAASVNTPLATLTTALVVLLAVGVRVAV